MLTAEAKAAVVGNQAAMTAGARAQQRQLQQAKQIARENRRLSQQRQQPMANSGW
ncbi:MAG: hypothetical protein ACYC61_14150 [Isosphaeraceae bacterium]